MRIPLKDAQEYAQKVIDFIMPYCEKAVVAGSIRRECHDIGDIDIVCKPQIDYEDTLFTLEMDRVVISHMDACKLADIGTVTANGQRLKKLDINTRYGLIKCQIAIVLPPAQWGVKLMIATGPAEFSHRAVTRTTFSNGLLSNKHYVKDGALHLLRNNDIVETPEEKDYFHYLNLDPKYLDPKERDIFKNMGTNTK